MGVVAIENPNPAAELVVTMLDVAPEVVATTNPGGDATGAGAAGAGVESNETLDCLVVAAVPSSKNRVLTETGACNLGADVAAVASVTNGENDATGRRTPIVAAPTAARNSSVSSRLSVERVTMRQKPISASR